VKLSKMIKYIKKSLNIYRIFKRIVIYIDKIVFVRLFHFPAYFTIQKALGFPIVKLNFYSSTGYYPSLKNPTSFNEKCTYSKLFSRNPLLPIIADKCRVRDYISERIGNDYLIPFHQVVSKAEDINYYALPNKFIIKTNFSSGQNIIISDKQAIDLDMITKKLNRWMHMKYRYQELIWFAQLIERKIIVEQLLQDADGEIPLDYKFYVFQGRVEIILAITDRFNNKKMTYFNRNWEQISLKKSSIENEQNLTKPNNRNEMVSIAELLGKEFDFIRVDLYSIAEKIYFGELTPNSGDGRTKFEPIEYDYKIGNYWKMDLKYIRK
jgi:hypothetical protein